MLSGLILKTDLNVHIEDDMMFEGATVTASLTKRDVAAAVM